MVQGFVTLFTDLSWFIILALTISLVCLAFEVFSPSFGLVGICGVLLGVLGVLLACREIWGNTSEVLWLIADILIIFFVVIGAVRLVKLISDNYKRRDKIKYIVVDGNRVPADEMGNPNFSFLIGKTGECITDLKPSGKVKIDGNIYNVLSEKKYLYNGNEVVVVRTVSSSIFVEKV